MNIRRAAVPVALAAALVLVGCGQDAEFIDDDAPASPSQTDGSGDGAEVDGDDDDDAADGTEPDRTETDGTETDGTETDGAETDGADTDGTEDDDGVDGQTSDPSLAQISPEDAIATITYPLPGTEDPENETVTVGLHELRIKGEVMQLQLSFTPEATGGDLYGIYDMNGHTRLDPRLNDRENLKQYLVLEGSGLWGEWATGTVNRDPKVSTGQTLAYWANFAAPQDDIDTIDVAVIAGVPEFEDVVIERGEG